MDLKYSDQIIRLLGARTSPMRINEIAKALFVRSDSEAYQTLKNTLKELIRQNVITKLNRGRYTLNDFTESSTFPGIIKITKDQSYVDINSKEYPRVFIRRRHLATAFDGDKVLIKLLAVKEGKKPRAEVVEILKRKSSIITGTIERDGSFAFIIPDNEKFYIDFLVPESNLKGAKSGDKVEAAFVRWEDPYKSPVAHVLRIVGKAGDATAEMDSVLTEFALPKEFPQKVVDYTESISGKISPQEIKRRLDLRNETVITIDPNDAKDFDDALSLKILNNGNYKLGVHIADVSHYVSTSTELDIEAYMRATSVYLVDRVIPMLPEKLSNDICSLKPNRNRLTYSVFMEIDPKGNLKNYSVKETIIRSKRRFTYDEVLQIIENKGSDKQRDCPDLVLGLHKLAEILKQNRYKSGGVEFNTYEVKFILDKDKQPVDIKIKTTNAATSLVEECMLIANKTVAEHIEHLSKTYHCDKNLPFLYRVHDEPNIAKLNDVIDFLRLFGMKQQFQNHSTYELNSLIKYFEDKPEKPIANQLLLRAMSKAEYSHKNIGHYGLGFEHYAHFTSPIRRYPDLIVHRLLKEYSANKPTKKRISNITDYLKEAEVHNTSRERLAMEAERASTKLTQTVFAAKFIDEKFMGTISGVTSFGLFVLLDGILAEGLLHIKDLADDFYLFDEKKFRLVGRRKKKIFSFGKRICIKITKTNINRRKIELEYLGDDCENLTTVKKKSRHTKRK